MRQAQNTDTHALNQLPKMVRHTNPVSLLSSTFGIHLEPGYNSHGQIIHFYTAKKPRKSLKTTTTSTTKTNKEKKKKKKSGSFSQFLF